MTQRREFLKAAATVAAGSMITSTLGTPFTLMKKGKLRKIGIQLFSLPKMLEADFRDTIGMLAEMGYGEIEPYGPYPFSADVAQASWKALGPMLGFSGSGYFGLSATEVASVFKENKLTAPSMHTDLDTLRTRMTQLGEAGNELGFTYAVLPAIPAGERKTLDDYKRRAEEFNKIGAEAKKNGIRFGYHNHGYGLHEKNGKIPLNIILDNTDPELVFFEMDIYWTTAGGMDPVQQLNAYPGRYVMMHVKDMKEDKRFSGDGDDPSQWIELFPYMTTAGAGVMDLEAIISAGKANGVKHFYVEQDVVADPEVALKKSIDYLKSL